MLFLNAERHRDENRLLRNNENTLMENKSFVEEIETDFFKFKTNLS